MRARARSHMRHAIARVQTIGGHAVATGGVRVHVCGGVDYAAASLAARKLAPTSVCEHVNAWLTCGDGWSAIPLKEDVHARSRRSRRETQLGAAPPLLGGTSRLHRQHLAHCPPRLRRLRAAAEALVTASTWAAR